MLRTTFISNLHMNYGDIQTLRLRNSDEILGSSPSRLRHLDSAAGPGPRAVRLGHRRSDYLPLWTWPPWRTYRPWPPCRLWPPCRPLPPCALCAPCAPRRAAIRPNWVVTCLRLIQAQPGLAHIVTSVTRIIFFRESAVWTAFAGSDILSHYAKITHYAALLRHYTIVLRKYYMQLFLCRNSLNYTAA